MTLRIIPGIGIQIIQSRGCKQVYRDTVLRTKPIAYWPLDESSGTTAHDHSGNDLHGTYEGVTLGQAGIGDGSVAPFFDGVNDYVDVFSTGLAQKFNGAEGTVLAWAKVADVNPSTSQYMMNVGRNYSNRATIQRQQAGNHTATYVAGGVYSTVTNLGSEGKWYCYVLTYSKVADEVKGYSDGVGVGTLTGLGTWSGAVGMATIGAYYLDTLVGPWHGYLAHCALWDRALTPAEVAALAVIP